MTQFKKGPNDIVVTLSNSEIPWSFNVTNLSNIPYNVSSYTFVLHIDSVQNPISVGSEICQIVGSPTTTSGEVEFYIPTELQSTLTSSYYYRLEIQDEIFNNNTLKSGRIHFVPTVLLGVSALDLKPDAVSGQLGQVFNLTNTSGIYSFAGGPIYRDDTSGISILFARAEEGYWATGTSFVNDPRRSGGSLKSIRLQVSFDDGESLYDAGNIITPDVSSSPTGNATTIPVDDVLANIILVTKRGNYLYAYYSIERISVGDPLNVLKDYAFLAVARANYQDVFQAASNKQVCPWYKYYNGSFSEPGLGGDATNLLKFIPALGINYDAFNPPTGFYSEELGKTVILYNTKLRIIDNNLVLDDPSLVQKNTFVIYSDDGINFSYPQRLTSTLNKTEAISVVSRKSYLGLAGDELTLYSTSGTYLDTDTLPVLRYSLATEPLTTPQGSLEGSFAVDYSIKYSWDRGQLHKYVATLHKLQERKKLLEASAYYYSNPSEYIRDNSWRNVLQSYANSSTELSGNFPNQIEDYTRFEYGRDFHKLYKEYTNNFRRHSTSPTILNLDGPLVTAHTFGSVIYNSKFELNGSSAQTYPHLITSSLDNAKPLRYGEGVFTSAAAASGTYTASSILNYGSSIFEYRNSGILNHIELCHTTESSRDNEFTVIDIFGKSKASTRRNPLIGDNVLIRQVAKTGFSRLIFDISKYPVDSGYYANTTNFLTPNHEFKLSFNALIGDLDVVSMGGGAVGVWIHTKPELGKVWSFTKDMKWVQHDASGIRKDDVMSRYSHLINIPEKVRSLEEAGIGPNKFKCAKVLDKNNPNVINDLVSTYSEKDFYKVEINFNTSNRTCDRNVITIPVDYINGISSDLHRLNQNYVIEIFTVPQQNNKFTLFYGLNMVDLTMNKMAKPYYSLLACGQEELRIEMLPEELLTIFKYFNQIAGDFDTGKVGNLTGYASRVFTITSGILESRGGSRINYVESPDWSPTTRNAENFIEGITIIN